MYVAVVRGDAGRIAWSEISRVDVLDNVLNTIQTIALSRLSLLGTTGWTRLGLFVAIDVVDRDTFYAKRANARIFRSNVNQCGYPILIYDQLLGHRATEIAAMIRFYRDHEEERSRLAVWPGPTVAK